MMRMRWCIYYECSKNEAYEIRTGRVDIVMV